MAAVKHKATKNDRVTSAKSVTSAKGIASVLKRKKGVRAANTDTASPKGRSNSRRPQRAGGTTTLPNRAKAAV